MSTLAELRLTYLKKPYFVTMGTFHMGIMLHFNNSETLSYSELLQHTRLPDKELTKQLQSLVETKIIDTEVRWNCFLTGLDIITTSVAEYVKFTKFYMPTACY